MVLDSNRIGHACEYICYTRIHPGLHRSDIKIFMQGGEWNVMDVITEYNSYISGDPRISMFITEVKESSIEGFYWLTCKIMTEDESLYIEPKYLEGGTKWVNSTVSYNTSEYKQHSKEETTVQDKKGIFKYRQNIKPEEYPEVNKYVDAIHESFWTVHEFNFSADIQQFKTSLSPHEGEAVKRTMLAISHVENKVKTFWGNIGNRLPKPEISDVGYTFAGNEIIHKQAYSELLTLLGLDDDFLYLNNVREIADRTEYLQRYLKGVNDRSDKEFTKSLILFTLLVENVSLFSQFLIISSFYKYRGVLANISKVIQATSLEEEIHALFGAHVINIIREENPEWFDDSMEQKIRRNIRKAYDAECGIIDWIFEMGELEFMPKDVIKEFLKDRFNKSLKSIGYSPEYEVNEELLESTEYFNILMNTTTNFDFFHARSTDYSKGKKFTVDEIF